MPQRGTLSVDKARDLIGYEPAWSLERGLQEYVDWYRTVDELGAGRAAPEPAVATAVHSCLSP